MHTEFENGFKKIETMSNPKEKAEELFNKYWIFFVHSNATDIHSLTKQCALIAVDEILKSHDELIDCFKEPEDYIKIENYYKEVKQEIEKL